jgi:hypothetical protein
VAWDQQSGRPPPEGDEGDPSDGETTTREALESFLHGPDTDEAVVPGSLRIDAAEALGPTLSEIPASTRPSASDDAESSWETLLRAEESRWHRYGHPCVAVELQIVGGSDLASHLGDEAGERVRNILAHLLTTTTRASDHYESRPGWRTVALLPETDEAGGIVALDRIRVTFAAALGPALAVRLAVGAAVPSPSGSLRAAFHQAARAAAVDRRRPASEVAATASSVNVGATTEVAAEIPDVAGRPGATQAGTEPTGEGDVRLPALEGRARLDVLVRLLEDGYVSQAEYDAKRAEILDRL